MSCYVISFNTFTIVLRCNAVLGFCNLVTNMVRSLFNHSLIMQATISCFRVKTNYRTQSGFTAKIRIHNYTKYVPWCMCTRFRNKLDKLSILFLNLVHVKFTKGSFFYCKPLNCLSYFLITVYVS